MNPLLELSAVCEHGEDGGPPSVSITEPSETDVASNIAESASLAGCGAGDCTTGPTAPLTVADHADERIGDAASPEGGFSTNFGAFG